MIFKVKNNVLQIINEMAIGDFTNLARLKRSLSKAHVHFGHISNPQGTIIQVNLPLKPVIPVTTKQTKNENSKNTSRIHSKGSKRRAT